MAALQGGYADRGGAGAAAVGLTLPCASRRMLCGMPPRQCEKLPPCALNFRRSAKLEGWPDEVRLRAGRSAEGFGYNTRHTTRPLHTKRRSTSRSNVIGEMHGLAIPHRKRQSRLVQGTAGCLVRHPDGARGAQF